MKLNVVWRAWYPTYIGVGSSMKTKHEQGIAKIKSVEQLRDFWEENSIHYGEQGGNFEVLFGWDGKLRDKDARYYNTKQLFDMLR